MMKIKNVVSDDTVSTINLTVQFISDPSKISELADTLDGFVNKYSQNPLLLSGFITQFMSSTRVKDWTPFFSCGNSR